MATCYTVMVKTFLGNDFVLGLVKYLIKWPTFYMIPEYRNANDAMHNTRFN